MSRDKRLSWQTIGQENSVQDIRIDGYRPAVATQAVTRDKVQVIVQLPIRTQDGHANVLVRPEIAAQVGRQLLELSRQLLPDDHEVFK